MAGAIGASLLIVAALTVAMLSGLATAGIGLGPFAKATHVPPAPALESPPVTLVDTPADSAPAEVDDSGAPGPRPQDQLCPCP